MTADVIDFVTKRNAHLGMRDCSPICVQDIMLYPVLPNERERAFDLNVFLPWPKQDPFVRVGLVRSVGCCETEGFQAHCHFYYQVTVDQFTQTSMMYEPIYTMSDLNRACGTLRTYTSLYGDPFPNEYMDTVAWVLGKVATHEALPEVA